MIWRPMKDAPRAQHHRILALWDDSAGPTVIWWHKGLQSFTDGSHDEDGRILSFDPDWFLCWAEIPPPPPLPFR